MQYVFAWLVVLLAGFAGLVGFYLLSRSIPSLYQRTLVRCLVITWIFIPAPVPNYLGNYAPAFVVMIFEWLFQTEGDPVPASQILVAATLSVIGLVSLAHGLNLYRKRRQHVA